MPDLIFNIRPWNRLTNKATTQGQTKHGPASNHVGDVIEVRIPGERADPTVKERTFFYWLKVRDVPERAATHILRHDKIEDPTIGTNRPRVMGFGGPDPSFEVARAFFMDGLPHPVQANIMAYFNRDVEQPVDKILSIPWLAVRTKLYNKVTGKAPTGRELDVDASKEMKIIQERLQELDTLRWIL